MTKSLLRHSLPVAIVAGALAAVFVSPLVGAIPAQAEEAKTHRAESTQERKEAAHMRLSEAKLKACQNREKAIQNIMARIANRGEKQLEVFTKISERTQAFYAKKGKVLANYDALVAEVATKKATAEVAVAAIKDADVTFDCESENPKATVESFKASLKARNAALKEYKTAIKNLIVGVKSVQSTATRTDEGGEQ